MAYQSHGNIVYKFPSCKVLLKQEIVSFLPYKQDGKVRVETYDLIYFNVVVIRKEMIWISCCDVSVAS